MHHADGMSTSTSLIVRGLIGIVFGIVAFTWPGLTLTALVFLFGIYALLDGIANITHNTGLSGSRDWVVILQGVIGILAGVFAFVWPTITLFVLVLMVGIWAVLTGILQIAAAIRLRKYISYEWMLATGGVLSVILGALIFAFPLTGALVLAWWIAAYAIVAGIVLLTLGVRLRQNVVLHHRHA